VQRWGLLPQGKGWTPERQHKYAKLIGKMKLSMPGSLTVFQGEELGLPDADVAKYLKRNNNSSKWDEQALAQYLSDYEGCRGMMPWTGKQVAADNGWVGTPPEYAQFTPDRNPTLEAYKKFIRFRKDSEPLLNGDIEMLHDDHKNVIAFTRTAPDGEKLFCAFNFGPRAVGVTSPDGLKVKLDPVDCYIGDARIKRTWEEMGGAARNA
jgi:alpha-glucosidase